MRGLRETLRRALGRGGDSRSVPDGGVVVDNPDEQGSVTTGADGADADATATADDEAHTVTDERGVNRAETLAGAGFEQVFDATSVPTFILDAEGNVAEWNESIVSLTGTEREDAVGHSHVSELFYPDGRRADTLADKVLDAPDTADAVHGVERCDSARNRYRDTSTMVDRHGDEKHIEFTATPLYDGDEVIGVTEVVVDRTENVTQREATAALLAEVRETAEAIGDGDLDARARRKSSFETLDEDRLRVIEVVNAMAENLDTLSTSVHEQAREIDGTVREASDAAADIAANVDEQNELLEESVSEMQSFSAGMEEVAATADQVDSAAVAASEAADEGLDASEDAREATEDVVEIGDELVDSVGALSERMDDIEEVIEVISDVAEQTNLLALNANIEAARAGDGGDGFAVVAEEVKKLADETRGYTEDITGSLDELQAQSDETSAAVERSHERIEDAGTEIETVLDSLEAIAGAVDEAAAGVAEVARTTDDQAATVEELTSSLEAVRERSDRTETATDRIVDATDEQEAAVDELIARVERLDANQ
ncbi:methyl-accepting chemotaxis sensory transducer with Pas/Pac sensor [Halorubrum aidingense JCM 13560]|uniref:Methyl-accepting chemotaxis sensory transducer with Pas/Pac sensor n=1 Tax=Halorubrum aidingense JCM 13560 TaxID=1230454 RepID=M0P7U0_9EURY|nr:methyl-accepting chemotaxis protein [Halorubrum aidingense]EMA66076.1 methyl-accepting chemotaxis sensory transducer with Pas/Pac sensor [Halorubrum aidingense JCM 13560]